MTDGRVDGRTEAFTISPSLSKKRGDNNNNNDDDDDDDDNINNNKSE